MYCLNRLRAIIRGRITVVATVCLAMCAEIEGQGRTFCCSGTLPKATRSLYQMVNGEKDTSNQALIYWHTTSQKLGFRLTQLAAQGLKSYHWAISLGHIKGIILTPGLIGQLEIDYFEYLA
jgi:hypothetical protein